MNDAGLLQQVLRYLSSHHCSSIGELHLQVFAEAAGVSVDDGAGVPKRLHQAVDQQDLLLQRATIGLNRKHKVKSQSHSGEEAETTNS